MSGEVLKFPKRDDAITARDLLEELLRGMDAGEYNPMGIFIGFTEPVPGKSDTMQFPFLTCGLTRLELIGMLEIFKQNVYE